MGYNKFLRLESDITVSIDTEKLQKDTAWYGLKGYVANSNLAKEEIIENYQYLWQIEKAFRISKTDLKYAPFITEYNQGLKRTYASLLLLIRCIKN